MKKFGFLWGTLLLIVLIVAYCTTLTIFISEWFIILAVVCVAFSVKLMSLSFLEAQLLQRRQKYELMVTLHKFGYLFLLITFGCVLFIAKNPAEHHIISTTIGIGCFCNYILSHALRNILGSWWQTKHKKTLPIYGIFNELAEKSSLVFHNFYFIVIMLQL